MVGNTLATTETNSIETTGKYSERFRDRLGVTGKAAEPRQSTGPHQDAQYRDEDSRRHEQEPYVTPNCAFCPVIRPEPTRTLATIQPKMNPPTWAKNATPLPPVSDGWATA
jgi:hypothetical protein